MDFSGGVAAFHTSLVLSRQWVCTVQCQEVITAACPFLGWRSSPEHFITVFHSTFTHSSAGTAPLALWGRCLALVPSLAMQF